MTRPAWPDLLIRRLVIWLFVKSWFILGSGLGLGSAAKTVRRLDLSSCHLLAVGASFPVDACESLIISELRVVFCPVPVRQLNSALLVVCLYRLYIWFIIFLPVFVFQVKLWKIDTNKMQLGIEGKLEGHRRGIWDAKFSPNGQVKLWIIHPLLISWLDHWFPVMFWVTAWCWLVLFKFILWLFGGDRQCLIKYLLLYQLYCKFGETSCCWAKV